MAVDDALSDLGAALSAQPQQQPGISYSVAPTSGVDAALADLAKSPEQLRAEIGTPANPGGIVHNTANAAAEIKKATVIEPSEVMSIIALFNQGDRHSAMPTRIALLNWSIVFS